VSIDSSKNQPVRPEILKQRLQIRTVEHAESFFDYLDIRIVADQLIQNQRAWRAFDKHLNVVPFHIKSGIVEIGFEFLANPYHR